MSGKVLASLLHIRSNIARQIPCWLERRYYPERSTCKRPVISGIHYCIDRKSFSRTLDYKSLEIL